LGALKTWVSKLCLTKGTRGGQRDHVMKDQTTAYGAGGALGKIFYAQKKKKKEARNWAKGFRSRRPPASGGCKTEGTGPALVPGTNGEKLVRPKAEASPSAAPVVGPSSKRGHGGEDRAEKRAKK